MTTSAPCNIEYVLSLVGKNIFDKAKLTPVDLQRIQQGGRAIIPSFRVLDLGCGYGKWGFLLRDSFDAALGHNHDPKDWKIHITAVDAFPKAINAIHEAVYDEILFADIFDVVDDLGTYDLVMMGDVIEHMEKERAHYLLQKLFSHTQNIIISTPEGFLPQGAVAGNEYEIHLSGWTLDDFAQYKVVEHRSILDTFFKDLVSFVYPGAAENWELKLLVVWIQPR